MIMKTKCHFNIFVKIIIMTIDLQSRIKTKNACHKKTKNQEQKQEKVCANRHLPTPNHQKRRHFTL